MLDGTAVHTCDVLVVGAGPAGSAAAYWLARAGVDVLIVDRAAFPRAKPCGDGLTPQAVGEMVAMGIGHDLLARAMPFVGVRVSVEAAQLTHFDLPARPVGEPQQGLVLPRLQLDEQLFRHAQAAGARAIEAVGRLHPHYLDGAWRFTTVAGGQQLTLLPRLTCLATGANRTLLYRMGLAQEAPPSGLALRGYVDGVPALEPYLDIYLERSLLAGYGWAFPVGAHRVNIGAGIALLSLTPSEANRRLHQVFARLVASAQRTGGQLGGPPQGYPIQTNYPDIPVSYDGVLLLGETAGLVDPLTGEGIANALTSGRLAAHTAIEALHAGNTSSRTLAAYDRALQQRFGTYFADARELLARIEHPHIMETLVARVRSDRQISYAMQRAIVDGRPRDGIQVLEQALASHDELAAVLFALQAYLPLLARCRSFLLAQVKQDAPTPALLSLLRRGKMLRALLVFLGCQAAGGEPERVLAAAAGIELVHAASLVHDDIMDEADVRREQPALHVQHGIARAIVGGDYLLAKSFELLAMSKMSNPAANVVEAFLIGARSGIRTCAGQWRDVGSWPDAMLVEENYLNLVADKTAAPIAGALQAGAVLAGAPATLLQQLADFGNLVGRAFQVRDDVLDWQEMMAGAENDRRPTLPLIHAFRQGTHAERLRIREFLNGGSVDRTSLQQLFDHHGSLQYAADVGETLVTQALTVASSLPNVQPVMHALARYVLLRSA